jgi:hypothetical protein
VRGYGNGFGQFAVTDNLDGLFQAFQKSALLQKFRGDTVPGIERLKDFQTNQRIVGLEYIIEAPLHGQSLYQLVLTTLESGPNRATGTGFLSFHTPAGRASLACGGSCVSWPPDWGPPDVPSLGIPLRCKHYKNQKTPVGAVGLNLALDNGFYDSPEP